MQRTEHYNLSKPEPADRFLASDIGANLDAIDEAIHNAAESGTASVDGMDIKPASVTATGDVAATGAVKGSSVSDSVGSLAQLRDSVAHVYQPSRPEKKDLLRIDLNDKDSPHNRPHIVRADDVSTLASVPPGITSGPLYGLWDCSVLDIYGNNHAQILVTFREMVPVCGRVWTNWFNYQQWEGWKSVTPM